MYICIEFTRVVYARCRNPRPCYNELVARTHASQRTQPFCLSKDVIVVLPSAASVVQFLKAWEFNFRQTRAKNSTKNYDGNHMLCVVLLIIITVSPFSNFRCRRLVSTLFVAPRGVFNLSSTYVRHTARGAGLVAGSSVDLRC